MKAKLGKVAASAVAVAAAATGKGDFPVGPCCFVVHCNSCLFLFESFLSPGSCDSQSLILQQLVLLHPNHVMIPAGCASCLLSPGSVLTLPYKSKALMRYCCLLPTGPLPGSTFFINKGKLHWWCLHEFNVDSWLNMICTWQQVPHGTYVGYDAELWPEFAGIPELCSTHACIYPCSSDHSFWCWALTRTRWHSWLVYYTCMHSCIRLGRGLAEICRRRGSPRLAESLWRMGGTLVTDECHLFDW